MTGRTTFNAGEICWTDLQTKDVEAAKAFYTAVFGWRYEDLPTPDGRSYAKAYLGDDLVTVIAPQNPQQEASGTAARWNIYFAAADAGAIVEETPHAGGTVEFGPEDVEDTGVMVFLAPPGGGTTGVWQPGTHTGVARYNEPGALAWAELLTPEPQAAVAFFQQLFGHEVTEYPQDDGGTYTTLMVDGAEVAGIAPLPEEEQDEDEAEFWGAEPEYAVGKGDEAAPDEHALQTGWQVYFGVSSVAEAVASAVAAGAVVLIEPEGDGSADEEAGSVATLKDPQGGVFSVLEV
ncbi:VOC family protein [Arthrobacter oryzae]|jgi:predicted enzyme related to lactoylglutathione lyase|uniref:VOC family protein n=1 Tax=Arthrobacter oryzae TaxID=409290 RepID=UPI00286320E4|nr:VOC family protein [Arthrobacter oryzae]MDR6506855.1 putative enzyme related to lactoylglutathione lyase [Arthrobacter oryzae]